MTKNLTHVGSYKNARNQQQVESNGEIWFKFMCNLQTIFIS